MINNKIKSDKIFGEPFQCSLRRFLCFIFAQHWRMIYEILIILQNKTITLN